MKKILLFFAAAGLLLSTVASCDSEPKNPGDFSKKAEISLSDIMSLTTGETYPIRIIRDYDSIYQNKRVVRDTVFNEDGSQTINTDTIIVPSKFTAHIYRTESVYLPAFADTFQVDVTSNARWYAPAPTTSTNWYNSMENTTGGGDSYFTFRTVRNRNTTRATPANLKVYSSDSAVMYIIPLYQRGERD